MTEIIIRKAKREDCATIRALIQELANFEKMSDQPRIDYKTLEKDGFDGHPLFFCNVATFNEKLIGYVLFYNSYSTWFGKCMFMDDLYVTPEFRGKHVGIRLIKSVAKEAIENDCKRLDFTVLKWNPATEFYKKYKANDLTTAEEWHFYRFSDLKKLVSECE